MLASFEAMGDIDRKRPEMRQSPREADARGQDGGDAGQPIIRRAVPGEIESCARLYVEIAESEFHWRPAGFFRTEDFLSYAEREELWVAETDGAIAGFLSYFAPEHFLHSLYVQRGARGQGIGAALIAHARGTLRVAAHPEGGRAERGGAAVLRPPWLCRDRVRRDGRGGLDRIALALSAHPRLAGERFRPSFKAMSDIDQERLSVLGQPAELPATPDEAVLDTVANPHGGVDFVVRFTAPEFTSLCPVTGQPDFAHLVIDYLPDRLIVESKSLKLFLASFRNHGAFHEDCTVEIAQSADRRDGAQMAAHRRLLVSARRHADRRLLPDRRPAPRPLDPRARRGALSRAGVGDSSAITVRVSNTSPHPDPPPAGGRGGAGLRRNHILSPRRGAKSPSAF